MLLLHVCCPIVRQNCDNEELTFDAQPIQSSAGADSAHADALLSVAVISGCMMHITPSLLINQSSNQSHFLIWGSSAEVITIQDPSVAYTINKNHACYSSQMVVNMDSTQFLTQSLCETESLSHRDLQ